MSLIQVKVQSSEIFKREGIAASTGKPYKIIYQDIFVELHGEVRRVQLNIPDQTSGYSPGKYTIDPIDLITIGRFGFEFNRFSEIKLIPVSPIPSMTK